MTQPSSEEVKAQQEANLDRARWAELVDLLRKIEAHMDRYLRKRSRPRTQYWETKMADWIWPRNEVMRLKAQNASLCRALNTIVANTEPDAIKHRDYDHLAHDVCECAKAALAALGSPHE